MEKNAILVAIFIAAHCGNIAVSTWQRLSPELVVCNSDGPN